MVIDRGWNKCDYCGRYIKYSDFSDGKAVRRMTTPDSEYSVEEYVTVCVECSKYAG